MSFRSLLLLASASVAIAQSASECENLTNVTEFLQADDGKTYCSSVLSFGTVTNTVVESTTALETTTITTPSEVTVSMTTTQTDTISSGTITTTAPLFMVTSTSTTTTTAYSCPTTVFFRRDVEAHLTAYMSPEPTPSVDEWEYEDCEEEDDEVSETLPADYDVHSITPSAAYPTDAPEMYLSSTSIPGHMSSYLGHSTFSNDAKYAQASGKSVAPYPSGYVGSSYSYLSMPSATEHSQVSSNSTTYRPSGVISSSQPHLAMPSDTKHSQVSSNSTMYYPSGVISSSQSHMAISSVSQQPHVSINSTVYSTGGSTMHSTGEITASSIIFSPIPTPTPTPAPKPSCDVAPTALRTGYACDTLSSACGCLGLSPATEELTTTSTYTEAVYTTESMLITTTTQLTETVYTTVPAATETESPSSTVIEIAVATETVCPCSGSATSLCGTTPDTCKDFQTETSNCGSCGNTCVSGDTCSAGKCETPAIPEVPSCTASKCANYITCGAGGSCLCVSTAEGKGACVLPTTQCTGNCKSSSDCGTDEVCAVDTCCGRGICIKPVNVCANVASATRMFRRKTWDGETVGGGM